MLTIAPVPRRAYANARFCTDASQPCFGRGAGLGRQSGRNPSSPNRAPSACSLLASTRGRGAPRPAVGAPGRNQRPPSTFARGCIAAEGATAGLLGVSWRTALQLALGARRVGRWRRLVCHGCMRPRPAADLCLRPKGGVRSGPSDTIGMDEGSSRCCPSRRCCSARIAAASAARVGADAAEETRHSGLPVVPLHHDGKCPVDRSRRELPRPRADLQPLSRQGRGWRGTPIGLLPSLGEEGIDTEGLGVTPEAIAKLLEVDVEGCKQQLPQMHEHHAEFGESRRSCTRCSRSWTSACTPTEPGDRTHSARRTPKRAQPLAPMTRSIVKIPADAGEDSEVYVNGVRQQPDLHVCLDRRELSFDRALRRDHVSGRRWLLGPWDMGTYRQIDTVDIPIRSERRNAGRTRNTDRA